MSVEIELYTDERLRETTHLGWWVLRLHCAPVQEMHAITYGTLVAAGLTTLKNKPASFGGSFQVCTLTDLGHATAEAMAADVGIETKQSLLILTLGYKPWGFKQEFQRKRHKKYKYAIGENRRAK